MANLACRFHVKKPDVRPAIKALVPGSAGGRGGVPPKRPGKDYSAIKSGCNKKYGPRFVPEPATCAPLWFFTALNGSLNTSHSLSGDWRHYKTVIVDLTDLFPPTWQQICSKFVRRDSLALFECTKSDVDYDMGGRIDVIYFAITTLDTVYFKKDIE
ncbi:hypothetical protein J6590_039425 [Homalodisca vitripennis]|nr:hypothetical protein J6590_039425 [Homalodisca vitripennis]